MAYSLGRGSMACFVQLPSRENGCGEVHCILRRSSIWSSIENWAQVISKWLGTGPIERGEAMGQIDLWLALGVFVSTAATDAVYVMFNAAVSSRRRLPATTWSSVWYLLSAFAVISYTKNWVYVGFAASGSWVGAYLSMRLVHGPGAAAATPNMRR
jgi:hypothetical protein